MALSHALHEAKRQLVSVTDRPYFEAQQLLAHITQLTVTQLHMLGNAKLETWQYDHLQNLLQRRLKHEPLAYLLGYWSFYGLDLKVTPEVLIPRPETEVLVDTVLENGSTSGLTVADVGTGSGAIAISLAYNRPNWHIFGLDNSQDALRVAEDNVRRHKLTNVTLMHGEWLEPLKHSRVGLVVSNPPYIPVDDPHLQQTSLSYEPRAALDGGIDGLRAIRSIINQSPDYLLHHGYLCLEHGYDQQQQVMALMAREFSGINAVNDWQGQPRVVWGKLTGGYGHG